MRAPIITLCLFIAPELLAQRFNMIEIKTRRGTIEETPKAITQIPVDYRSRRYTSRVDYYFKARSNHLAVELILKNPSDEPLQLRLKTRSGKGLKSNITLDPGQTLGKKFNLRLKKLDDIRFRVEILGHNPLVIEGFSVVGAKFASNFCKQWSETEWIGKLPITESSGLAFSRIFADTAYHMNDSANDALVYVTSHRGELKRQVQLDVPNKDWESLAIGPCPFEKSCLYIGDTGDNFFIRKEKFIYVVPETELNKDSGPVHAITIRYEYQDGAKHDVESFAQHPVTKDFYFFTKELFGSKAYRLPYTALKNTDDLHEAVFVREIPVKIATGADFSPDGKRTLILNYVHAYEFDLDFKNPAHLTKPLDKGWDYGQIEVARQAQQEAVSYLDNKTMVFTSEKDSNKIGKLKCIE